MDCKVSGDTFIDFHFGTLSPAERTRVETHLASCPACLQDYFDLKRDLETQDELQKPSELVKHRVRRDFAEYCASLVSAEQKEWLYSHRVRITFGFLAIAAAFLLILYSGQLRVPEQKTHDASPSYEQGELKSLDEAVDSGRLSPGHINMI